MEILLNITWAVCSLILVGFWLRSGVASSQPRRTQLFALSMAVLLLLPVISLSDDLLAMQAPAETDTCVRRVQQLDNLHPATLLPALPSRVYVPALIGFVSVQLPSRQNDVVPSFQLPSAMDSRPPPQA
ncbi:hypothetical protein ACFPT7_13400 [Acidicapsa dinghuensis]|uniref:Uncharacterized protein n=1 Tax=Acidicapsa dinghuensis TaxID=2218256 RepID=A0ABW1EH56_9BACT|nr:hypothetical protein [Acidicapsa dinghuensis]